MSGTITVTSRLSLGCELVPVDRGWDLFPRRLTEGLCWAEKDSNKMKLVRKVPGNVWRSSSRTGREFRDRQCIANGSLGHSEPLNACLEMFIEII